MRKMHVSISLTVWCDMLLYMIRNSVSKTFIWLLSPTFSLMDFQTFLFPYLTGVDQRKVFVIYIKFKISKISVNRPSSTFLSVLGTLYIFDILEVIEYRFSNCLYMTVIKIFCSYNSLNRRCITVHSFTSYTGKQKKNDIWFYNEI